MYGYTFCRYILLHHPILSESVNNVPARCSAVYALRAAESIHIVIVTYNITDNVLTLTHPPPFLQLGKIQFKSRFTGDLLLHLAIPLSCWA